MDSKIRILHFPIGNTKGGATQYAMQNWKFIDKSKFHFDFATMSPYVDFEDKINQSGAKLFFIRNYAENNSQKFREEFYDVLLQGRYDIVHLHTGRWKSTFAEQVAKEAGVKRIIIHAHSTGMATESETEREKNLLRHQEIVANLSIDIATDYWACSRAASKFLFADSIPEERVHIMPNAIDIERFAFRQDIREKVRKEMGWKDSYVIGHIGRFVYPKNQEFLLKLIKHLISFIPSIKLVLVGDGVNLERCKEYTYQNNLDEHVVFTGYRADTERLLQAFDVFALPSEFEGVSLALIEAQAAGLPCYASDCMPTDAGITESVKFIPLQIEDWSDQIQKDFQSRQKRADNIEKLKLAGYDIRDQIKAVEKGYLGIY